MSEQLPSNSQSNSSANPALATKKELENVTKDPATKEELKEMSTDVKKIGNLWEDQKRLFISRQFVKHVLKSIGSVEPAVVSDMTFRNCKDVIDYIEDNYVMLRYFNTIVNEWIENDDTNQARAEFERLKDQIYHDQRNENSIEVKKHVKSRSKEEKKKAKEEKKAKSIEERFGLKAKGIGQLIGIVKGKDFESFKSKLVAIKSDLENLENDHERLTKCESSGITLLIFEALSQYVDSVNQIVSEDNVDSENKNVAKIINLADALKNTLHQHYHDLDAEMEVDVRGSISVAKNHCTISMGEIKSSAKDIAKAKKQLFIRMMCIKLIVSILYPEINAWVLKGFIFGSFSQEQRQSVNGNVANGISFYVFNC